ncbi:MAG: hypothetical protein R8K21_01720 [Mariprofundales bacterium]
MWHIRQTFIQTKAHGFVLVTSLVMLALLSMMSIGMYYRGLINQQSSFAMQSSAQGFYFAELGLNYMAWALNPTIPNDIDFNADGLMDYYGNLQAASGFPGFLNIPDGQLNYFDNRTLANRVHVHDGPGTAAANLRDPAFFTGMKFLLFELNATADSLTITPGATAIPTTGNGAAVWLTGGYHPALAALDATTKCATVGVVNCDIVVPADPITYNIVIYSLGFVNGEPRRLLRLAERIPAPTAN